MIQLKMSSVVKVGHIIIGIKNVVQDYWKGIYLALNDSSRGKYNQVRVESLVDGRRDTMFLFNGTATGGLRFDPKDEEQRHTIIDTIFIPEKWK